MSASARADAFADLIGRDAESELLDELIDGLPDAGEALIVRCVQSLQETAASVGVLEPAVDAAQVIDWVEASGKTLKHIFITHGHGDHWFGTGPILERFPDVTVLAAPGTIEVALIAVSTGQDQRESLTLRACRPGRSS